MRSTRPAAGPCPRGTRTSPPRTCCSRCSGARTTRTSPTCWPRWTPTRRPYAPGPSASTVAPPQPNRELLAVIADAAEKAKELGDEYLSTEHLLIGIAAKGGHTG